ncbi:MAG: putative RNA methyltransferase [Halioglobus sp.]
MNWICPNCRKPLSQDGNSLLCEAGHCFDLAKEGYVNLLPASRKRSKDPGDNREMVAARRRVHDAQLYRPLAEKLSTWIHTLADNQGPVLDLGCGEGYYTGVLNREAGSTSIYGIDIAKPAVRLAAKAIPGVCFAVASSFDIPLADGSVDVAFSVFAPTDPEELARVIRPGGYYLDVSPAPLHLWQLRELLYENPRHHDQLVRNLPSFEPVDTQQLEFTLQLADTQLRDLIAMTPYAYGGRREHKQKLTQLDSLELQVAFSLNLYRRRPD